MFHKINKDKTEDKTRRVDVFTISGKQTDKDLEGFPILDAEQQDHYDAYAREKSLVSKYVETLTEEKKEPHESKGMAVMTEATSERVDRIRQNMPEKSRHSAIHTIN